MAARQEGGYHELMPGQADGTSSTPAKNTRKRKTPLIVIAGEITAWAASRDWAAKGTGPTRVRRGRGQKLPSASTAVNLIGMGVLPLQFPEGTGDRKPRSHREETFSITWPERLSQAGPNPPLEIKKADGSTQSVNLTVASIRISKWIIIATAASFNYVLRDILSGN